MSTLRSILVMACFTCALNASAQNQDAVKALGSIFQTLLAPTNAPTTSQSGKNGSVSNVLSMLSQSVEQINEPKEIEIGRQLAAVLLGTKPLHRNLNLQRYVNRLGRWIALQSGRPDLPWTFAVLDDPGFNAFAAPGGYIFVTKGMLDRVADESELAGILAHEISHVVEKHHLNAIQKSARSGLLTQVLASQLRTDLAGQVSAQLLGLGRDLYSKGLDKQDEFDADRNGVALAARAGFDPYGLVASLQQLSFATPDDAIFSLALSTHPPAQLRLDQLATAMGQRLESYTGGPSISVTQRLSHAGRP
jgi:predicted Zn-dependent protease